MKKKNTKSKEGSSPSLLQSDYKKFESIDGHHPWMKQVPEGCLTYNARILKSGHVAYFNFNLAIEMGLLDKNHPHKLNKKLEKKILETFNLRIINEYDIEKKTSYPTESIKKNKFMATRYLQLQHQNKKGETSGDGRGIWNGYVRNQGKIWDVSSRGTGVTALAPGAVEANKPLQTGNIDFGYGCGLAEIDELYSSAIMAEILHLNDVNTERMLAIIDHGNGMGIGVRAGQNLIRPAHLFVYLKQDNYEALKKATDYLIQRQTDNKEWSIPLESKNKYRKMLEEITFDFAQFTSQLERDYIFAWLDWDGDNVLANAGIIDYGSIRQFGVRHDQYRYDDVERLSTNLNEQKTKASLIVQAFAQLVDFLETGTKKQLAEFKNHKAIEKFQSAYDYYLIDRFLFQLGLTTDLREWVLLKHKALANNLFKNFELLEKAKTKRPTVKVDDGYNRPAIYNMRKVLFNLPQLILNKNGDGFTEEYDVEHIFNLMKVEEIDPVDQNLSRSTKQKIQNFINDYQMLMGKILKHQNLGEGIEALGTRSKIINRPDRVTGNSLVFIVSEILKKKKQGLEQKHIQKVIDHFIEAQCLNPKIKESVSQDRFRGSKKSKLLVKTMLELLDGYKEDI